MLHAITDETFDAEVANSPVPCLVLFTGSWCGLCHKMIPTLESLSELYGERLKFCTVDTDIQKKLRIKFAVATLPFVVYIHDHKKSALFDEYVTEERLKERIDFMLDGGTAPTTMPL